MPFLLFLKKRQNLKLSSVPLTFLWTRSNEDPDKCQRVWHSIRVCRPILLAESKSILCVKLFKVCHERIQRGAGGSNPLKTHKNIEFLSKTGLDPLKITKQPSQHSM